MGAVNFFETVNNLLQCGIFQSHEFTGYKIVPQVRFSESEILQGKVGSPILSFPDWICLRYEMPLFAKCLDQLIYRKLPGQLAAIDYFFTSGGRLG